MKICCLLVAVLPLAAAQITLRQGADELRIEPRGVRFTIASHGKTVVAPHSESGLLIGNPDQLEPCNAEPAARPPFTVRCGTLSATVDVHLQPHQLDVTVTPSSTAAVVLRSGGASPGYGLGDHAVVNRPFDTDVTGYENAHFLSGQGLTRLVSNFVIYPRAGFAVLVWDAHVKIVRSTRKEVAQGVRTASGPVRFSYFFGTPHEIYLAYLKSRNESPYPVMTPKYEFFGVGWEAWGALGWETNQKTITNSVDRYLSLGYPIQWMVIGSGFWPRAEQRFHETTSFGLYDPNLYPHPKKLIAHFHAKGLKFFQGLRISFIVDGPFSKEGVARGYFIQEAGKAKVFSLGWPKSPCYLLDDNNADAVAWYVSLVQKWMDYGVDGFKEDLYGFGRYNLPDDKLDHVNQALMRAGVFIMGRNQYLGSPADLHRINDFNYDQNQDRGPVNALALAYSGLPLIYPDTVGGTFAEDRFSTSITDRMKRYIMRNAQWASVHAAMGMGQPPWFFNDQQVARVMLDAALLHERLHPYLYSQAIRWTHDGFPWPMAPLPIVFPHDPRVFGRENDKVRGYEWMIGDALLACPLYGNDYDTAGTRDVYLPAGDWIDYDTGKRFTGPKLLAGFALPPGKTPLFVGGTGLVVEQTSRGLVCRVYPVAKSAGTTFWARDGRTASHIRVAVQDWNSAHVVGVNAKWIRHALEFQLQPGRDYEVR